MPRVTVPLSWNGLPTASTHSATRSLLESPHGSVCRFLASTFYDGQVGDVVERRRASPLPLSAVGSVTRMSAPVVADDVVFVRM